MRGVQIWRSGSVQSHAEFLDAPAVVCLCYQTLSEWHLGVIASCQATIGEAILLAKERQSQLDEASVLSTRKSFMIVPLSQLQN